MKKSLAIICAVAILITSLCGTFLLSSANSGGEYTAATIPGFATNKGAGDPIVPVAGENVTTDVILRSGSAGGSVGKYAENTANIPFPALIEFGKDDVTPAGWGSYFNFYLDSNSVAGKGFIYYVEAPASTPFAIYAYGSYNGNQMYRGGAGNAATIPYMYTLEKGDAAWTQVEYYGTGATYRIEVPAGFKGYVYSPFRFMSNSNYSNTSKATAGDEIDAGFYLGYITINEGEKALLSPPLVVAGDPNDETLPSAKGISAGGVNYDFFPANTLDGTEVVFPTYNGTNLQGGETSVPTTVVEGGAVNSVKNTTNLPLPNLFEITSAHQAQSKYRDIKITPAAGKGAIFYLDAPVSAGTEFKLGVYMIHDNGTAYRYGNTPYTMYTLAEGDTAWKANTMINYGIEVNGFKGYVYLPFVMLDQNAGGIVTNGSKINTMRIYFEAGSTIIPADDSLVISAPIIVKGAVDASPAAATAPDAKNLNDATNVYTYFRERKLENNANSIMIVNPAKAPADIKVGETPSTLYISNPGSAVTHTVVNSVGGLTGLPDVKVSSTNASEHFLVAFSALDKQTAAKAVGFMNYYKLGNEARDFKITIKARDVEGTDLNGFIYNGKVWALADGDTEWKQVDINAYKYQLPANFSGYVKVIFAESKFAFANSAHNVDMIYNLVNVNIGTYSEVAADKAVTIGQPIHIYQDANTNICMIGQALNISDGSVEGHVVGGTTPPADDDDDDDQGGTTPPPAGDEDDDDDDDNQGGGTTPDPTPTPTQPDYKVDPYTGAAIDYSKFSIQNVTVGKLKGVVTIGADVPAAAVTPGKDQKVTAVDSKIGITKYPSFKLEGTSLSFYFDKEVAPTNPKEVMYYIELPAGKSANVQFLWNFYNKEGLAYYNMMYSGNASIMATGAKEWTNVKVNAYNVSLPAGFKGYVKFIVNNIKAQENSPAGDTETFKADTEKFLNNTSVQFTSGIEATDAVYLSTPIFVTKGGSVPYVAFVDGEENAARNLFTGAVMTAADLKDYEGVEGNENLNQGAAPAINYNIPNYTGAKETYGNYEFARVRQFILAGNVAKGYAIPLTAFDDYSETKDNACTKLVDTTLGISKMPLFSITKTTGNPSENNVTVAVWHPDKTNAQNKGPGAIMQYIKVPADMEKVFIGVYMNLEDEDHLAKNIAPYNGVLYYMQKGTNEWVSAKISAYWAELPKGFDGYIMFETAPLKTQGSSEDFADTWQLYNYNLRIANLKNQTVVASAPFWMDKKGDIDYAAYLNDDQKAVRDIFTGKVLKKDDVIKPLQIGDTIVKLPDYTNDAYTASIADKAALSSGTATVEWDAIDNAVKYIVRIFKKVNTDDGIAYNFVAMTETTETSATITDLELNTQYAIVVYGYDAKNDEIFVFDYINASTAGSPSAPTTKPSTPTTPGLVDDVEEEGTNWLLIGLIAGGAVLLIGAAVVVILVVAKKRKTKI